MFPKGIRYNKKLEVCRTEKYNSVFLWIARQQQDLSNKKTGMPELSLDYAGLVELMRKMSNQFINVFCNFKSNI